MKYNVLVEGPYLTQSGYGEHARLVLNSLKNNPNIEIYGAPLSWGKTSWISSDDKEREWLDEISLKSVDAPEKFDLHVFIGMPLEFTKKAPKAVCVTAGIEVDRVDPQWLIKTYELDKIIVPSEFSRAVFLNSTYKTSDPDDESASEEVQTLQCQCPVEVVPYHIRDRKSTALGLNLKTKFNFLTVAQWGPRKNLENTIAWFVEEFKNNRDVGLVVKTNMARNCNIDFEITTRAIKQVLAMSDPESKRKCKVHLLHGDLTEEEMGSLYNDRKIKAIISATHGEGFGLPLFEAAAHKLPVVVTNATGHVDFLYCADAEGKIKPHFAPVEFSIAPVPDEAVWDGVIPDGSRWAFPDRESFREQLRAVYEDYDKFRDLAKRLQQHIRKNFSVDEIKNKLENQIMSVVEDDISTLNPTVFS